MKEKHNEKIKMKEKTMKKLPPVKQPLAFFSTL